MAISPPKVNCLNCRGIGTNLVFGKVTKCGQCYGTGYKRIPMVYKSVEVEQVSSEKLKSTILTVEDSAKPDEPEQPNTVDGAPLIEYEDKPIYKKRMTRAERMAKFKSQL